MNLGSLVSETRNPDTLDLDVLPTLEMLRRFNEEDKRVAHAVSETLPEVAKAVDAAAAALTRGGRLIYMGAGTSGRLGVLDASECPPTFGVPHGVVVGLIAGGPGALLKAVEGAEDNAQLGEEVKIEYNRPLPEKFDLVITAKAFGPNAGKPVPVKVGDSEQTLTLGNEVSTTTLHFENPTRSNTLVIVPPEPQSTNEGNILGHSPRRLGIGMVSIKVINASG